jgi:hypothetical protein
VSSLELKNVLLLRRGLADDADPEIAEALALANNDPEMREWLEQQREFHDSVRQSFRQLAVPAGLKHRILVHAPAVRLTWWQRFPVWAAAAALLILYLGFSSWWRAGDGDAFPTFRSRMVRSVLRQYQMELRTNNLVAIRQFLQEREAPSDFVLKDGLSRLSPVGAGLLSWQGRRVSMVCLNSGGRGTAILFVVDAASLKDPPQSQPSFKKVSKLMTASWTTAGRTYVLMLDNAMIDEGALGEFL